MGIAAFNTCPAVTTFSVAVTGFDAKEPAETCSSGHD